MKSHTLLGLLLLSGVCTDALAQTPAPPPQAQQEVDPNTLASAGGRAMQALDGGRAGDLWDGASQIAKQATKRNDFVANVANARKPLGAPVSRAWSAVRRQQIASGDRLPPGQYASVEFLTRFASGKSVRELVSFRLEEAGVWRFTGYVLE